MAQSHQRMERLVSESQPFKCSSMGWVEIRPMHQIIYCRYGEERVAADSCLVLLVNAFVFGHGPASPTLADVLMLTGLDISTADNSHLFNTKPSSKVETRAIGGWSGYIQKYRKTRSVGEREQAIFLKCGWISLYSVANRRDQPLSIYRQRKDWPMVADFLLADICSDLFITFSIR